MNEVSNRAIQIMLTNDENEANKLYDELNETKSYLIDLQDLKSSDFISVIQGMLRHEIINKAENLDGIFFKAFNRICTSIQGCDWRMSGEGKSYKAYDEPRFSTWEEALNPSKNKENNNEYYEILQIKRTSSQMEIKKSYRKLALKWHPDVNKDSDAESRFKAISEAYDILSDEKSRELYDKYGKEGMKGMKNANSGQGNANREWDEFKPFKKENKQTKAREASTINSEDQNDDTLEPKTGDIVEYPLSDVVKAELKDGRIKGIGLLVSCNKDRGDATTLPEELLTMCEIEPLRQESIASNRWIPDEIVPSAYCCLTTLKKVKFESYDRRFDVWTINEEFSPGCAGPEIVDEIIL